jgi:hypothetical protein
MNPSSKKSADQVAKILSEIYEKKFGGKGRGRYQISYAGLKHIAGRARLGEKFMAEVGDELFEMGFVLVNLAPDFAVVDLAIMGRYRKVPQSILLKYVALEGLDSDEREQAEEE